MQVYVLFFSFSPFFNVSRVHGNVRKSYVPLALLPSLPRDDDKILRREEDFEEI